MGKKACVDCGAVLTGHGTPKRCRSCSARARYVAKHGKPPEIIVGKCEVCRMEFRDYASNRRKGKVRLCSAECRAAWTGVSNSIKRGGDGRKRTKREKDKIYYRGEAAEKIRTAARRRYAAKRTEILAALKARDRAMKLEVIAAYGGACECCGEKHIEFLTIDHINGDGAEHRRSVCGKGRKVYQDIKRQGFPTDKYRCLCLNCNISLGFYGYCPHHPELKRQVDKRPHKPGRQRVVK